MKFARYRTVFRLRCGCGETTDVTRLRERKCEQCQWPLVYYANPCTLRVSNHATLDVTRAEVVAKRKTGKGRRR